MLRKRTFFKPWFMGIPKGLGLLPTAQPSICVLSDIHLLLGMNDVGRKAWISSRGTCSPSWLHHFISIGRWSPKDSESLQRACLYPPSPSMSLPLHHFHFFLVIFLFSLLLKKILGHQSLAELHSGFF